MGDFNKRTIKYPSLRDGMLKDSESWISGRVIDDNTGGLWRIHDGLYDFTDFINKHPGGSDWLSITKGMDITEAFESHHISTYPEKLISSFFVRKATTERFSPYTFHENGFYRTLKLRIREQMKYVDKTQASRSKNIIDRLAALVFIMAILANSTSYSFVKYFSIIISATCLAFTTVAAHNFFHQRDNWRMWLFNLIGVSARDWRIRHVLSHHHYPNTILDQDLNDMEPLIYFLPKPDKSFTTRYLSWLYIFLMLFTFIDLAIVRRCIMLASGKSKYTGVQDLLMFTIPTAMYIFGNNTFWGTIFNWILLYHLASFIFGCIGLTASHHHPDIYHYGDEAHQDSDWGILQLDTVMDRTEINGSLFRTLVTFGDHGLHHLFPTIDQAILEQLHPVLEKTCQEYKTSLRMTTWPSLAFGMFQTIARNEPKKRT